ncbi:hypothetical protein [uncultured Cohaesibacter sp.]|uniref:hypothetical protein n=1 Tax=uncultured Cohaesibacter sp. TaxID=1002546 RepID=UPI0029C91534|nr:hypothetical protein [uncultured Cohaesibacter sp.]
MTKSSKHPTFNDGQGASRFGPVGHACALLLFGLMSHTALAQDPRLPVTTVSVEANRTRAIVAPSSILDLPLMANDVLPDIMYPTFHLNGLNLPGFKAISGHHPSIDFTSSNSLAQNATTQGEAPQDAAAPVNSSDSSMPSAMTTPVLPNVPSSLKEGDPSQPDNTPDAQPKPTISQDGGKSAQTVGKPDEGTSPTSSNGASEQSSKGANVSAPSPQATQPNAATEQDLSNHRPVLRRSLSVLYTEQRPFLLYASDASITYLMPNAFNGNPELSHDLRTILEDRALSRWQEIRDSRANSETDAGAETSERPSLVITGRVEDSFFSDDYISLYMEEERSLGDVSSPKTILSFNYTRDDNKSFGLTDLFQGANDKALEAVAQLLTAYIQADIVRQKSIRLGTEVTPQQDAWLKNLQPNLAFLNTFTLVPSRGSGKIAGLRFHFDPGLLGAEADGSYDVYVPSAIFAPSLAKRFAEDFGGEALNTSRHYAPGFSTASVDLEGLKTDADIGGEMLLEGEVPSNWCDGFHLSLMDKGSGQIVAEAIVNMLPDVPTFGLADNMLRFRAELSVPGNGGTGGQLVFEPYRIAVEDGRLQPRPGSACQTDREITLPDPEQDTVSIPVTY